MIKEFQSHPAFVDLMETFRSAFNVNEKDMSRMPGHTGDGRLAEVRERLRKKAEAKKATTPVPAAAPAPVKNTVDESEDFPSIAVPRRKKK
jgi:hypothetical protein